MEFTQPVSMRIPSKEDFERDLKEPLDKLGYRLKDKIALEDEQYLMTNYAGYNNDITFLNNEYILRHNRHFIDHYNPQLFIALSSMTDEPNGIVGEWFRFASDCDTSLVMKRNHFDSIPNLKHWRKATKEELIEFFTKTPEKEGIKSEESKTIEELFFADPIKFMDGLAYCRHQLVSHIENEPKKIATLMSDIVTLSKRAIELIDEEIKDKDIPYLEHQKMISTYESRIKELEEKISSLEYLHKNQRDMLYDIRQILNPL